MSPKLIKRIQHETTAQAEAKRRKDEVERRNRLRHRVLCGAKSPQNPLYGTIVT